ncbi:uncharacterized protein LOC128164625 [Crassostrea angulata]|uniref:uncharacterized protein LOC128164625 n=1 Tax=Magallana angulata TaxID=2784310 RepID=UPI0022B0A8C4|nr:uncharacterized protein LOC128164625 [Crassostrea angulata]
MKRERSSERKSYSSSKRRCIDASSNRENESQWYDVLLELHIKSSYKLTSAINKSEDRRELPTVPQPTHTIEWLARTSFRHHPINVPQQRKHKVAKRQVQHSQLDTSFLVH